MVARQCGSVTRSFVQALCTREPKTLCNWGLRFPTACDDVAAGICALLLKDARGVVTASISQCSWCSLCCRHSHIPRCNLLTYRGHSHVARSCLLTLTLFTLTLLCSLCLLSLHNVLTQAAPHESLKSSIQLNLAAFQHQNPLPSHRARGTLTLSRCSLLHTTLQPDKRHHTSH